jgi:hypothetical protein
MFYHLNEALNLIDITAACGKVIAFIEFMDFAVHYPYFRNILDNLCF